MESKVVKKKPAVINEDFEKAVKDMEECRLNEIEKSILWKYDSELGIAYFCPKCKLFLCGGSETKCKCGQQIDWSNKVEYKGKVKWY